LKIHVKIYSKEAVLGLQSKSSLKEIYSEATK